jgi:hypothetical protein
MKPSGTGTLGIALSDWSTETSRLRGDQAVTKGPGIGPESVTVWKANGASVLVYDTASIVDVREELAYRI